MNPFFDRNEKISDRHKQLDIKDIETELKKRHGPDFPSNWEDYLILEWKDWRDKIMKCEYSAETWIYQSFLREIKDWISRHCDNPQYFKKVYLEKIQKELAEYKISFASLEFSGEKFFPQKPPIFVLVRDKKYSISDISNKEFTNNIKWEQYLTLDYWKNWQEKIINEVDVNKLWLYERRLIYLKGFIVDKIKGAFYANLNQERNIRNISIEEEEKRVAKIENNKDWENDVSNDFWKKHPVHFRKLTTEDIFFGRIDKFTLDRLVIYATNLGINLQLTETKSNSLISPHLFTTSHNNKSRKSLKV